MKLTIAEAIAKLNLRKQNLDHIYEYEGEGALQAYAIRIRENEIEHCLQMLREIVEEKEREEHPLYRLDPSGAVSRVGVDYWAAKAAQEREEGLGEEDLDRYDPERC